MVRAKAPVYGPVEDTADLQFPGASAGAVGPASYRTHTDWHAPPVSWRIIIQNPWGSRAVLPVPSRRRKRTCCGVWRWWALGGTVRRQMEAGALHDRRVVGCQSIGLRYHQCGMPMVGCKPWQPIAGAGNRHERVSHCLPYRCPGQVAATRRCGVTRTSRGNVVAVLRGGVLNALRTAHAHTDACYW